MSIDQLMALVPIEAASSQPVVSGGRKSRWERSRPQAKGKTKWGNAEDRPYHPPPFADLPPGLTQTKMDQFLREQRLDELAAKLGRGELEEGDPDIRPPSPPPTYDRLGNRTNKREVRIKAAMDAELQRLVEYCVKTVEGFVPPHDFRPAKKVKRITIPQDKYPEYNFMGLIIGPRGCNHKRLELESGAQISIRGKGTQKEGKRTDQTEEEAAMPQHVHVAADSEEKLEIAVNLIEPLLDPFHPMHEEFKKRGLEQLALVNGVQLTKSEQRCAVCGATGHLAWECPDTLVQNFKKPEVKCAYCGDLGHVTTDCKIAKEEGVSPEELRKREDESKVEAVKVAAAAAAARVAAAAAPPPPPPPQPPATPAYDSWKMDEEYRKMMSEISGGTPNPVAGATGSMMDGPDDVGSAARRDAMRNGVGDYSSRPPSRAVPPPPPPPPGEPSRDLMSYGGGGGASDGADRYYQGGPPPFMPMMPPHGSHFRLPSQQSAAGPPGGDWQYIAAANYAAAHQYAPQMMMSPEMLSAMTSQMGAAAIDPNAAAEDATADGAANGAPSQGGEAAITAEQHQQHAAAMAAQAAACWPGMGAGMMWQHMAAGNPAVWDQNASQHFAAFMAAQQGMAAGWDPAAMAAACMDMSAYGSGMGGWGG